MGTSKAPRVLIVAADDREREMIELLLRAHAYETATAVDAQHALEYMRDRRPCLVLLDVHGSMMDASTFRERQLGNPAVADVPVVCMTAMLHPADVEGRLGIQCLGKPLDFPALLLAVERACGRPPG